MESKQKEMGSTSVEIVGEETKVHCPVCNSTETIKKCSFCNKTVTPLWRTGPLGPKTLCNSCGIKYSKKRPRSSTARGGGGKEKRNGKGRKLMPLGKEVEEEVQKSPVTKEWGEVEKAALLLMALSCGITFT